MFNKIKYYLRTTNRRLALNKLLKLHENLYQGTVLDIGGRDRGKTQKPKNKVLKWIFADIEEKHHPDIILNVEDMNIIQTQTIDTINAIELFEHVENTEKAIAECLRVLKNDGTFILSVPFLFYIHADPHDFIRWTKNKWINVLEKNGFKILKTEITGRFFTVITNMHKVLIQALPPIIRHILYFTFPLLDLIKQMDKLNVVKNHHKLGNFHDGYFIVAKKINSR